MPVILTSDFPPAIGGIQRYLERVADRMTSLGHRVIVVAPHAIAGCDAADHERPYEVVRYGGTGRFGRMLAMARAARAARRRTGDDVLIASSWYPTGIVAAALRTIDGGTLAIMAFGSEIARQDTPLRKLAMRSIFGRADCAISISRFTSSQLRKAGVTREAVLAGCGVDPGFGISKPGFIPTILTVGRLVRRKGFDRVIAALAHLRHRFPNVRYEIVGEGPDRRYLSQLASDLGVADHVVFRGALDEREMREAFERAWCFALPVRAERHDVEGFGLVYLEAAAAGLVAVGGRGSGADDAIDDGVTGLLVDGRSTESVTHALDVLLRDRDFAAMLSDAAYERAMRDFSWERVATTIARSVGIA